MSNTYNNKTFVNWGEDTYHNTSRKWDITIDSAQVRWQGNNNTITESHTEFNPEYSINTDGVGTTFRLYFLDGTHDDDAFYASQSHTVIHAESAGEVEYDWAIFDNNGNKIKSGSDSNKLNPDNTTNNRSTNTHFYEEIVLNQGGYAELTPTYMEPHDGNDMGFDFWANSHYHIETTYKTENPSVGGDISASYSGTLNDDEYSPWYNISLDANQNNHFYHEIDESGQADFQLQYDWSYVSPTPIEYFRVEVDGQTYNLPLIDPNDDALQKPGFRFNVDGQTLAADLVDPGSPKTSPFRVYHPNYGVLAWRKDF